MDGVYPTYYTLVRASTASPFGSFSCSSTGTLANQETGPTPPGFDYAGKYTVDSSSTTGAAGQRTLDTLWPQDDPTTGKSRAYQGVTSWYRDMVRFPAGFQPIANSDFGWVYEIHQWPDSSGDSMLSCGVNTTTYAKSPTSDGGMSLTPRLSCRIMGGASPTNPINGYGSGNWSSNPDAKWDYFIGANPITYDHWYDMAFRIRWDWRNDPTKDGCVDATAAEGCFEWWLDGVKVASWGGPTLWYFSDNNTNVSGTTPGPGQGYIQHGYYRSTQGTWSASVYHGATMAGASAASIGENLP